jgi:hypothetical protein
MTGMPNDRVSLLALPYGGEPLVPEGFHCPEASTNHFLLLFPESPAPEPRFVAGAKIGLIAINTY